MTLNNTTQAQSISYEISVSLDFDFLKHADWQQFNDPVFGFFDKVVVVNDCDWGEGRDRYRIVAIELVPPEYFDQAPTWMYGIKPLRLGEKKLSIGDIRWFEADELCKVEHEHLIGGTEF